jgi:hypothetical protein
MTGLQKNAELDVLTPLSLRSWQSRNRFVGAFSQSGATKTGTSVNNQSCGSCSIDIDPHAPAFLSQPCCQGAMTDQQSMPIHCVPQRIIAPKRGSLEEALKNESLMLPFDDLLTWSCVN